MARELGGVAGVRGLRLRLAACPGRPYGLALANVRAAMRMLGVQDTRDCLQRILILEQAALEAWARYPSSNLFSRETAAQIPPMATKPSPANSTKRVLPIPSTKSHAPSATRCTGFMGR